MIRSVNPFRYDYVFFIVDNDPEKGLTACAVGLVDAANDVEAMEIAGAVFAVLDDTFHSYGLVHNNRTIACGPHLPTFTPKLRFANILGLHERKIRRLMVSLAESYPVLLQSAKLQAHLDHHRPEEDHD